MNELIKISDIVDKYGLTTRTLRYYEEVGLVSSVRTEDYAYRMYDEAAEKRIEEILILRKLDISIKEIQAVYAAEDGAPLLEILRQKMDAIDEELEVKKELRALIKRFVRDIEKRGVVGPKALKSYYESAEATSAERFDDERGIQTVEEARFSKLKAHIRSVKRAVECRFLSEPDGLWMSSVARNDADILNALGIAMQNILQASKVYRPDSSRKAETRILGVRLTEEGEVYTAAELRVPVGYKKNIRTVYCAARGVHPAGLDIRVVERDLLPIRHDLLFTFDYKNRKHYRRMCQRITRYLSLNYYTPAGKPVFEKEKRFAGGKVSATVPLIWTEKNLWFGSV